MSTGICKSPDSRNWRELYTNTKSIQKRRMQMKLRTLFVAWVILALGSAVLARQVTDSARATERITREVRHELLMLPYFGVFDNIAWWMDITSPLWDKSLAQP